MKFLPAIFLLCGAVFLSGGRARASDPLGLTAGVAADATLGALGTPGNFNTSLHSLNIGYSSAALTTRSFNVRLPSGFDPSNPSKKYGLVVFIDSANMPSFPAAYAAALDTYDVIWIAPHGAGNDIATTERSGAAIMGAFRISELYNIDPVRIYASGLSSGSRVASEMSYLRSDFFRGLIGRVGAALPEIIPDFSVGGNLSDVATFNDNDSDYEYFFAWAGQPSMVLPFHFRTALVSQYSDFRRAELLGIYRYGHLNHGNTARIILRPGGHSDTNGPSFAEALNLMYHPLVDVVWDRFENNFLPANFHPGKTAAGTGFTALSGNVTESTYSYNSASHGVLRLTGESSTASNDTFTWRNDFGVFLDARLRSENASTPGQNQRIGLHIVPVSASGPVADQPGFHLYWGYGQPHRAEIVSAEGTRKTLATWEHSGTHPMNLATSDKTFWNSTTAPDFAGRTRAFRGEDVRLVLNNTGFQLTFNRPVSNLVTDYPDKVVTATNVAPIDDPTANPTEALPLLLQGFWNEVETALVNALPSGEWRLVLSNQAIVSGQPMGAAVVDEIRVIGSTGLQAAPGSLAVTAPANTTRSLTWDQIHGAMGYVIQRSSSPDGPFTQIAAIGNHLKTYPDTVPSNIAYYYRVAALGSDGNTGYWSPTSFAKRSPSLPATPSNPAVTYPAGYQARLGWTDAASNETGYRVERSRAGFGQWSLVSGLLPAGTTVFLDTSVLAGAAYDYRISAINADGLSSYATISATVPDAAPPAPTALTASPGYGSVDLTWSAVPQAAGYRVQRANTPGGPYTTIGELIEASFSDTSFTPGTTHYYIVSAVSGSGLLASDSPEIAVTTLQLLPPSALTVTPGFTTNTLSWNAATGATSYYILRAASAGGPFATIATGLTETSFTDTALPTGTTYFYAIRSVNGTVLSEPGATVSSTPVPGTATKANNTTPLDQGSSWANGLVPGIFDTARWDGTYTSGTMTTGAGVSFGRLQLASPSTSITINTGGALTLGSGGIDFGSATASLTINVPVVLAANQPWSVGTSRNVFLNNVVSDDGAGNGITLGGPGGTVLSANNTFTGTTALNGGTLHLGATAGTTSGSVAGPLTMTGGTLRSNRTDAHTPIGGVFTSSAGTIQVNSSTGIFHLNATNLPAGSSNIFATLTGVSGATFAANGSPDSNLRFGGNVAGMNVRIANGTVTFTTTATAFNFLVEGGTLRSSSTDRLELSAVSGVQTFQLGGSGKLVVPGNLTASAASATRVFTMSGGNLAAATVNFTNLRSTPAAANGTFTHSGGTLAPGDLGTAGRTIVTGNYTLEAAAAISVDLGGSTQATAFQTGQYDFVSVSGATALAGELRVALLPGFTPTPLQSFTILSSAGTLSGAFSNVSFGSRLTTQGGEGSFLVSKSDGSVVLSDYKPALTPLQAWLQPYFGTTTPVGPAAADADPDGDGLPNLLEYALGSLPTDSTSASLPLAEIESLRVTLSFTPAVTGGLRYIVEASSNLSEWSEQSDITAFVEQGVPYRHTDTANLATAQRRFLRLRVISTQPTP